MSKEDRRRRRAIRRLNKNLTTKNKKVDSKPLPSKEGAEARYGRDVPLPKSKF